MKQGRPDRNVRESNKVEPNSKQVSINKVVGIGLQQVRTREVEMYKGRGFKAPMNVAQSHKSGSQGKR